MVTKRCPIGYRWRLGRGHLSGNLTHQELRDLSGNIEKGGRVRGAACDKRGTYSRLTVHLNQLR